MPSKKEKELVVFCIMLLLRFLIGYGLLYTYHMFIYFYLDTKNATFILLALFKHNF